MWRVEDGRETAGGGWLLGVYYSCSIVYSTSQCIVVNDKFAVSIAARSHIRRPI